MSCFIDSEPLVGGAHGPESPDYSPETLLGWLGQSKHGWPAVKAGLIVAGLGLLSACATGPDGFEPVAVAPTSETYRTQALQAQQETLLAHGHEPVAKGNIVLYMSAIARELKTAVGDTAVVSEDGELVLLRLSSELAFEVGSAELSGDSALHLESVGGVLASYSLSLVEISGHTDSTGSAAINQRLSGQRAQAVADVLQARGVDPARMVVEGRSDRQPLADNASDEGRRNNRRVEIRVVPLLAAKIEALPRDDKELPSPVMDN